MNKECELNKCSILTERRTELIFVPSKAKKQAGPTLGSQATVRLFNWSDNSETRSKKDMVRQFDQNGKIYFVRIPIEDSTNKMRHFLMIQL